MAARGCAVGGKRTEQLGRLGEFREAHPAPDVTVLEPTGPYERWQAVICEGTVPGDEREMILTDLDLGPFMARLEGLFDRPD